MIIHGDSIEELKKLDADSIDAIVTDPPYGLSSHSASSVADTIAKWATGETDYIPSGKGFLDKSWDSFVPPPALWGEALRVLKPGAHALIFAGSRTQDLMGISLRLAGFEIRDVIQWIYGEGFPKSLNIDKAIDAGLGFGRDVVGKQKITGTTRRVKHSSGIGHLSVIGRSVEYEETIIDVTAPASPQAKQWSGYGTALKPAYEPCLLVRKTTPLAFADNTLTYGVGGLNLGECRVGSGSRHRPAGRWAANVMIDPAIADDLGERAKYFYCTKAPVDEREAGLDKSLARANVHPTVKPIDLMRYLVRLITPKGGTVLDPFNGSGSTGCAAAIEKRDYIGIELNSQYVEIAKARIEYWSKATSYETPGKPSETDGVDLFNWRDHD